MKLRPKIDSHDYETKKGHVVRFLKAGDKVKITIMFRGREQSRPELGYNLLKRLASDVDEFGFVESSPKQDGRNMLMVLGPHKKKTEAKADVQAERDRRAAVRQASADAEQAQLADPPGAARGPAGHQASPRAGRQHGSRYRPLSRAGVCQRPPHPEATHRDGTPRSCAHGREQRWSGNAEDEDALRCQEAVPDHR